MRINKEKLTPQSSGSWGCPFRTSCKQYYYYNYSKGASANAVIAAPEKFELATQIIILLQSINRCIFFMGKNHKGHRYSLKAYIYIMYLQQSRL